MPRYLAGAVITMATAVVVIWLGLQFGRSIWFAFGVNWILMAWAVSLGRVLENPKGRFNGVSIQFPDSYFRTRSFESNGRIYEYLGVRWFRRLLRPLLWKLKAASLREGPEARQVMLRETRDPEAGHLIIFIPILGITIWALMRGWWDAAAWLMVFNLIHNAYPIMSMRQIRARVAQRPETLK
jgi:hypothetical protein